MMHNRCSATFYSVFIIMIIIMNIIIFHLLITLQFHQYSDDI